MVKPYLILKLSKQSNSSSLFDQHIADGHNLNKKATVRLGYLHGKERGSLERCKRFVKQNDRELVNIMNSLMTVPKGCRLKMG